MKKKITVCEYCGAPLIWTFRWAYKEMYCLNCGALGDMFMGKEVEITPELRLKKRVVDKIWKTLYHDRLLLPVSHYKINGCKKCDAGQYHGEHLTKNEIQKNKIGEKILGSMFKIFKANQ